MSAESNLTAAATVMVVDDDEIMRMVIEDLLSDAYRVVCVDSGEACIAACAERRPDLILLDVEMAGLDGYETCRRIKAADGAAPPVVFISARDQIQDRLKGYDAGGDDYILKPVAPEELRTKVVLRLKAAEEQAQIRQMAAYASTTAMTAMSSMGEMGVLLKALQQFNACARLESLAAAVIQALVDYGLDGMVRIRTPHATVMEATHGGVSPIEKSIIDQVASMGRIVEYRSRMSVSYERVALLVRNTPGDDDERRGRLRDHLAVLIEGADVRTQAIHRDHVIERAVINGSLTLDRIDASQKAVRIATTLALQDMTDQLEHAYVSLALSDSQERHVAEIVGAGIESVRKALQPESEIQRQLSAVIADLKSVTGQ